MNAATKEYSDLIQRIEDGFMEIDNDILVDLRKQDESYLKLCRQIGDMERDYPFILNVTEGEGNIFLTEEEHRALVKYFKLNLKKDNIERKRKICYTGKQLIKNYQTLPGKENGLETIRIAGGNNGI